MFLVTLLIIESDGAGLAAGVFHHLLGRGDECPKVLGATHFHGRVDLNCVALQGTDECTEIFENGFLIRQPSLAFGHMEVRLDEASSEVDQQLTYLYKSVGRLENVQPQTLIRVYSYRSGRSTSSHGTRSVEHPSM